MTLNRNTVVGLVVGALALVGAVVWATSSSSSICPCAEGDAACDCAEVTADAGVAAPSDAGVAAAAATETTTTVSEVVEGSVPASLTTETVPTTETTTTTETVAPTSATPPTVAPATTN